VIAWTQSLEEGVMLRGGRSFLFSFPILFSISLTFTLTRTIRYDLVVRRPYSGLTFTSILLFTNIYICGLPRSHS